MKNNPSLIVFASLMLVGAHSVVSQTSSDLSKLFGDWTGESKCVGTNPYCRDEVVVYHISQSKADPKKILIVADKVVDGKPEFMGDIECDFDREKQTLTSKFKIPRTGGTGVWRFKIDGDTMEATLTTLPENEIGRRVKVKRNVPPPKSPA